jgi:hypothetical protein
MDRAKKIVTIDNISNRNLTVMYGGDTVNDTILFYGQKYSINKQKLIDIYGEPPVLKKENKLHIFIFDEDSVYEYIKSKKVEGIFKGSFLKDISINGLDLKKTDTIHFSNSEVR